MREATAAVIRRIRPNIIVLAIGVATLSMGLSYLGYRIGGEAGTSLMSSAGVGGLFALKDLATKILDKEE